MGLDSLQLIEQWPLPPGEGPSTPCLIAADSDGFVYIADPGRQCVHKLDIFGRPLAKFWETARRAWGEAVAAPPHPVEVTVSTDKRTRIHVLDAARRAVFVLDSTGRLLELIQLQDVAAPCGLLVRGQALYIGDNARRVLSRVDGDGHTIGDAPGYDGLIRSIAGDRRHGLWLQPGAGRPLHFHLGSPLDEEPGSAFVERGLLWGGPFTADDLPAAWHRLRAMCPPIGSDTHFRFYVATADDRRRAPPIPHLEDRGWNTTGSAATSAWRPMPPDTADVLIDATATYLWIGAELQGNGRSSPHLDQIRIDFNHESYSRYLPEIYRTEADPALEQFLALMESFYADVESGIESIGRLFDVDAVPSDWLDWLADWLGVEFEEEWSDERKRHRLAGAFESHAWRGTPRGLLDALRRDAGVDAQIMEPLLHAHWWALPPEPSGQSAGHCVAVLGLTTRLSVADAQGAVLGTSATLDASHLIQHAEYGAPLYERFAHQFSVQVRRSQVHDDRALARVREVIEREKPAHTTYALQVIDSGLRIGAQTTIGVNTVLGGAPAAPVALDRDAWGAAPLQGNAGARIGAGARVGIDTRLNDTPE